MSQTEHPVSPQVDDAGAEASEGKRRHRPRGFARRVVTAVALVVLVLAGVAALSVAGARENRHPAIAARHGHSTVRTAVAVGAPSGQWTVAQAGRRALDGWLDGVDCASATSCVAVGTEAGAGTANARALVETLNGGSWSAEVAPGAPNASGNFLFSVSCPVAGSCVAVGYSFGQTSTGGTGTALIETLSHGSWSLTPAPSLSSTVVNSYLYGVSCPKVGTCVAVGMQDIGPSLHAPVIMTLRAGKWSVSATPDFGSRQGGLQGVSCTSPTACTAAGWQSSALANSSATLVESLSKGNWSVVSSPGSGQQSWHSTLPTGGLNGISCRAASCTAVGQFKGPVPAIDVLARRQWTAAASPDPDSVDGATGLLGVSCPITTSCVAVGSLAKAGIKDTPAGALGLPLGTLIETYSGGTWTLATSPSRLPAHSGLHAVSCAGGACVAVGQSGQSTSDASILKTLIVRAR